MSDARCPLHAYDSLHAEPTAADLAASVSVHETPHGAPVDCPHAHVERGTCEDCGAYLGGMGSRESCESCADGDGYVCERHREATS